MKNRTVQRRKARQYYYNYEKKKNGFSPKQCWDLDLTFIDFALPRLRYFRKHTHSRPYGMTEQEYDEKLDIIIKGFELKLKDEWWTWTEEQKETVEKARELFGELLYDLWD